MRFCTAAARPYIEKHDTVFTGGPVFAPNGTYYVPHPDKIDYVGEPSPGVDQAWEELTWGIIGTVSAPMWRLIDPGRYFLITKEEAEVNLRRDYSNDDLEEFWSPKRGGYDVG